MAIGTAAAILGSAVIGAGASALSSKKAANTAADASRYAADQNAAVSREIYNQTRTDLAPYNQAGQAGLAALMQRLGLAPQTAPGAQPAAQPASGNATPRPSVIGAQGSAAAPAQPDYAAYGAANPDLQAEWQNIVRTGNDDAFGGDPNRYYAWHYQQYGQQEGRPLPNAGQQPGTTPPPADPNAPAPTYYQETYADRPADLPVPTYQRSPDMAAPGPFSYTPQDIENDVGYRFARDQALSGVNAASAARGLLRSGDAAKALQDRAAGVAHQWDSDYFNRALQTYNANTDAYRYGQDRADRNFIDDRSYGTNLWNTQQGRRDNIFSEDRGFQAGRNDQAVSNLFGLAGIGQNAAAGTASAGNAFAQNVINSNNQRANTTANAAIANAANMSNLFGSAANAVGTYYGMRGRI